MKQISYQGYAQGGNFDPIKVSSANVSRIAAEGQRVLKGMADYAEQDLKNQRAQLEQTRYNQQLEQQWRDKNRQTQLQSIQSKREASTRDYQIKQGNLERAAQDRQELFKSLSSFSTKAFELATEMEERTFQEQSDEQYWKDVWEGVQYGVPGEELLADREAQHKLNQMGEAMDIRADMAEAAGADPIQVDYFRGLNRAQRHGRKRAMIERAGMEASQYISDAFLRDDKTEIQLADENGQMRTLTPQQAATSAEKAAFMPIILRQYMEERGLKGMKSAMLEPFYLKFKTAMEATMTATRKAEMEANADERINIAKDALYDSFSTDRAFGLYNTLRRSGGMSHAEARKALLETIYTTTDENGNLRYSESEIEQFLDAAFPDQPNKSIRDRYSADIAVYIRERAKLENTLHQEHEATGQRQWDQYNDELRSVLNDPKTQVDNAMLEPLIEKAKREGNAEGVKMLMQYQSEFSVEASTDKFYEELWTEKAVMGLLTVEEVRKSNASADMKAKFIDKAQKSETNAMPADLKKSIEEQLKSALSARIQEFNTTSIKDPTYHRALLAAQRQVMRDYALALNKPGTTPDQAAEYAIGRFQKEFDKEGGQYAVAQIDPKSGIRKPFYSKFTVAPTDQMSHPMTHAREAIKADPQAIQNQPILDRGELERYSQTIRSGKAAAVPMSAQYIANMLNGVSVSDVINAQLKHYDLPQIPLKAYEQALVSVDPAYQRLLTYTPNRTRVRIAGLASGQADAAPRVQGATNSPNEILRTWIAAGGDPKDAVLMTAIAMAESSGRQDAYRGDTDVYGWYQIRMAGAMGAERRAQFGLRSNSELFDPLTNVKAAMAIKQSQGLHAWEGYTNGSYQKFLPQAEAAMKSYGSGPWRQGSTMNWQVIEYLTGDASHPQYRADHGGQNYHEHVAFLSRAERDAAIAQLRRHGIKIGSMNDGEHAPGSYHYSDMAVDLPMPLHIQPGSREERAYSARVRKILGIS